MCIIDTCSSIFYARPHEYVKADYDTYLIFILMTGLNDVFLFVILLKEKHKNEDAD